MDEPTRSYTETRWRGFADWRPHPHNAILLDQVRAVLDEYRDHLPLTIRQVFYRLVGAYGYEKTEKAYNRLDEMLNRARRGRRIPFDAFRDDGGIASQVSSFPGKAGFWVAVRRAAEGYRRDRLDGQPVTVEVWCEAGGMVPQLVRVAQDYGVAVHTSGGFHSTTVRYEAACRMAARLMPTVVLSVGDHDPSGWAIFDAASEDVVALVDGLDGALPTFERIAVTLDQIERFSLPTAPPKERDSKRGGWGERGTVQAEALDPIDLAAEVRAAIESVLDLDQWRRVVRAEKRDRAALLREIDGRG